MSEECALRILTLFPISILVIVIIAENIQVSRYYVKISNFFSPNCGYKRFEKTKIKTIIYWKELIKYMINVAKKSHQYLRKYGYFEESIIHTFNDYDISLMDGVEIVLIKNKHSNENGFFEKCIICIRQNSFDTWYVNYRYIKTENKVHIYTNQPQYDGFLLKTIFENTIYWKPIFNEKYKNWTEFDNLFKAKKYVTEE